MDETLSGTGYVNIDHLLYEPEPDENDKAERYARQYCEAVTGVRPEPDGITP